MTKTTAELDQEIARALAQSGQPGNPQGGVLRNDPRSFDRVKTDSRSRETRRWVGRCKTCGKAHQRFGFLAQAFRERSPGKVESLGDVAVTQDGVYITGDLGTNPTKLVVPCGDHRATVHQVYDDARPGKRRSECGARCTNATGPACDCRCRGQNHGSGLPT